MPLVSLAENGVLYWYDPAEEETLNPAIGVKPIRLWEMRENSMGKRLFYKLGDEHLRLRNVVCHELTHAYSAHLRFPLWLNEGLAMLTVDHFLQRETVQRSTLQLLQTNPRAIPPGDYAKLAQMQEDAIVYAYAQGYWVTRYLFETCPSVLQRLLTKRRSPQAIKIELAHSLALSPETLWQELNTLALAHFTPLENIEP